MTQKINIDNVRRDYLEFRDSRSSLQMATIDGDGMPEASYAPFVWLDDACYLFLSQLARHTKNLSQNPAISLLLIEDEGSVRNQFARQRIIWYGKSQIINRDSEEFRNVMAFFRQRFGDFIDMIEPLQDFQLFRIIPESGRFIRGFAQAFELSGQGLNEISHIGPDRIPPQ